MVNSLLIILGKIISFLSRKLNLGNGSTWPGHLALLLNKNFLKEIIKKNPQLKIILITGTNGKTTSVALAKFILEKNGISVFSNQEGANLINGLTSSVIKNVNWFGHLHHQVALWEVDEFSLPLVLREVKPKAVVLLNLFRDQLDRYGEVNTILSRWENSLQNLDQETSIFINGDDPQLYYLGCSLKSKNLFFFGLDEKEMMIKELPHDVDFIYCPRCQKQLTYTKISYSHLGVFSCRSCNFHHENIVTFKDNKINYPLPGTYMKYNTHGVFLLLIKLFHLKLVKINKLTKHFSPHFGRQETIVYQGKKIFMILTKNPASFNQSLETARPLIKNKKANFLIVLNNRIPDGFDISWIWDVDFKKINNCFNQIYVTGDRAFDMALRLKYEFFPEKKIIVFKDLKEALDQAVSSTKNNQPLIVLPNYSAMLMIRKLLVGRKLL